MIMPLIIYHSLAVPEIPILSPHLTSSYARAASVSPTLLSPPTGAGLIPVHTGNLMQEHDPTWRPPSAQPVSNYLPNQHFSRESHNWQDAPYSYAPLVQRSISVGPHSQAPHDTAGLPTPYTPSPRFLPPPPTHLPYTGGVHPAALLETIDDYTDLDHVGGAITSLTSQNIHSAVHHRLVSPNPSSQSHSRDQPPTLSRTRPPPIPIPLLPNPHDSQGVLHSPRPVPSPKHSFYGSVPKSDKVSDLERMADEVGMQTANLSLDLPKGDASAGVRGPHGHKTADLSMDKILPPPPVLSGQNGQFLAQHVDSLFMTEPMLCRSYSSSTDHLPRAPPTPPIVPIKPIKLPKAPTELSGLGANLGKDVPPENGLDALERRLLAEVGTRKFNAEERPHVRSVVQPITIPPSGPPPDTANDSAISSLTLANRDGFLKATPEREQEQDRDSDERTQHNGGDAHSPSEDDRDARTQKGKSSRKLGKSKHSEEDLERVGRRRERKRVKGDEGRQLRQEAKGRIAAWLGEIDISVPPAIDDPIAFISPTASRFVPITESASFGSPPAEMTDNKVEERRGGNISTDKDVSASPNPRSSGFITISTLNTATTKGSSGGEASSLKPSPRRSSVNDFRQTPSSSPNRPPVSRSPSAEVKRSEPLPTRAPQPSSQPPLTQPTRLFPGRLPRFPPKPPDPKVKYDVRSARGGRGGKVTQAASLWATKANGNGNGNGNTNATSNARPGDTSPAPASAPKKPKIPTSPPAVRHPVLNVLRRSPISARSPPVGPGGGMSLNRVGSGGEARTGVGVSVGAGVGVGVGTREVSKPTKATTVPAVLSSSHAVPMLSSTASLARAKAHGPGQGLGQGRTLPPMISETISDLRSASKGSGGVKTSVGAAAAGVQGRALGDLAFGQARLRDLIKKYQG